MVVNFSVACIIRGVSKLLPNVGDLGFYTIPLLLSIHAIINIFVHLHLSTRFLSLRIGSCGWNW